jgi:hypothetical protein
MSLTPLPELFLYGRPGCRLCDETRVLLTGLLDARYQAGLRAPTLVERNIETDPDWQRAFFDTIPVVELDGNRLELATSVKRIQRLLSDVLDA